MSKDKAPETKSAIKEDVLALAAKIEQGLSIDKKTGQGTAKEEIYNENLPEGLTEETVKAVADYNTTFVAAGTYAFSKLAIDAMKSNKGLEEATTSIRMGVKDSLEVNVQRKKEYQNPLSKDSTPVTKFGVVTAKYEVQAGANRAQLKVVRNEMAELAMSYLSK